MRIHEFEKKVKNELSGFTAIHVPEEGDPFDWEYRLTKGKSAHKKYPKLNAESQSVNRYLSKCNKKPDILRRQNYQIATILMAALTKYCIFKGSDDDIEYIMKIAHYTADEMNAYMHDFTEIRQEYFTEYAMREVMILHRCLYDKLCEDQRIGRWASSSVPSDKKRQPKTNQANEIFHTIVTEMARRRILDSVILPVEEGFYSAYAEDYSCVRSFYYDSLLCYTRSLAMIEYASEEIELLCRATERELSTIEKRSFTEARQDIRKTTMPKARPALLTDAAYENSIINHVQDLKNQYERKYGQYKKALLEFEDNSAESITKYYKDWKLTKQDIFRKYSGFDLGESAFLAIYDGDETYMTEVGYLFIRMIGESIGLPYTEDELPELEDEEEWDEDAPPGDNGRLETPILTERETVFYSIDPESKRATSLRTFKLSSLIASFSDYCVKEEIFLRKSHIKAFRQMGYSERKARDFAVVIGTLRSIEWTEEYDPSLKMMLFEDKDPLHRREEETDTRIAQLERELSDLKRRLANSEKENKRLRHENAEKLRKIDRLEKSFTEDENEYDDCDEENHETEEEICPVEFPYRTEKKIVLVGGFPVFHQELLKYLPDIRIVPVSVHPDLSPIRDADAVFLQINKTSHSAYYSACDMAKSCSVPYYHLNYASARRCAEEIVRRLVNKA